MARLALAAGMSASASARLTRQSGSNFYYAFRILPREMPALRQLVHAHERTVVPHEGIRRLLAAAPDEIRERHGRSR